MSRREPGYRPEPKLYRITFDEYPGLVIRTRSTSIQSFMDIAGLSDSTRSNDPDEVRELFQLFSDVLVSWNLEYSTDGPVNADGHPKWFEGDPVQTTMDGLLSQDLDMGLSFIEGWMKAVGGVSVPLAQPSVDGSPSLVESLPMEPLSQNQAS